MATLTLQPDDTTAKDAYILSDSPTTNTDGNGYMVVGENNAAVSVTRGLIQFDLSSIPAGSTIDSATLYLTLREAGSFRASNNRTMRAYRLLQNWVEAQATWNIYSTGNNWGTAGAGNTTTDREATDIGTVAMATTDADESEKTITLTASKIQEMITGGSFTNNGFLLQMDTETDDQYQFYDSTVANSTNRPKIVVNYTLSATGNFFAFM